jgi:outer membrane protein OmpA-like peptidoglycan-associated protein
MFFEKCKIDISTQIHGNCFINRKNKMNKKVLQVSIRIFLFFVIFFNLAAQESNQTYGIFGGYNQNIHLANFQKIPDVPNCCPKFEYGYGSGYYFGFLFEQKLNYGFNLAARLELDNFNAVLSDLETTQVIVNNIPTEGEFDHTIDAVISHYQISLQAGYSVIENFKINAGLFAGIYGQTDYSQAETITKPQNSATFMDSVGNDSGRRIRNEFSGSLKNVTVPSFGALFSLSYDLQLNKNKSMKLSPEVHYQYFVNDIAENLDWKISALKFGLAVKYTPIEHQPKKQIFNKEDKIDTIKIYNDNITKNTFVIGQENISSLLNETGTEIITTELLKRTDTLFLKKEYNLEGQITAVGVDNSGKEIPNPVFRVEEYISNRLDPLLNYIFFDENSSEIPKRYSKIEKDKINKFEIENLYRDLTLDIYYNILNIIGKRMTENPTANITLTGCNSDNGNEKGNIDLSEKRSESVRNYLVNNWNIASNRIKIEKRNLPINASTPPDESEKAQENRRVEIFSDNNKILEHIFIEKTDHSSNPPIVRFKTEVTSDAGLKDWKISAYQNSDIDNKFITSSEADFPSQIDWELSKFQKIIPKTPEPIVYLLELQDKKGNQKKIENRSLPIDVITIKEKRLEKQGDYEIERYSLILFDFDKETIEGNNKKIVNFMSSRIKPESEIEISGYTDRTGDADYNKKLSERRAIATRTSLKRQDAAAIGKGEDELLYNNDYPEGRFYCRTVNVIVKTKVK